MTDRAKANAYAAAYRVRHRDRINARQRERHAALVAADNMHTAAALEVLRACAQALAAAYGPGWTTHPLYARVREVLQ